MRPRLRRSAAPATVDAPIASGVPGHGSLGPRRRAGGAARRRRARAIAGRRAGSARAGRRRRGGDGAARAAPWRRAPSSRAVRAWRGGVARARSRAPRDGRRRRPREPRELVGDGRRAELRRARAAPRACTAGVVVVRERRAQRARGSRHVARGEERRRARALLGGRGREQIEQRARDGVRRCSGARRRSRRMPTASTSAPRSPASHSSTVASGRCQTIDSRARPESSRLSWSASGSGRASGPARAAAASGCVGGPSACAIQSVQDVEARRGALVDGRRGQASRRGRRARARRPRTSTSPRPARAVASAAARRRRGGPRAAACPLRTALDARQSTCVRVASAPSAARDESGATPNRSASGSARGAATAASRRRPVRLARARPARPARTGPRRRPRGGRRGDGGRARARRTATHVPPAHAAPPARWAAQVVVRCSVSNTRASVSRRSPPAGRAEPMLVSGIQNRRNRAELATNPREDFR